MSITTEFVMYPDYLEARVEGTYDTDIAIAWFDVMLTKCRDYKLDKALVDIRPLEGLPGALEKTLYAYQLVEKYLAHEKKTGQRIQFSYLGKAPLINSYEPGVDLILMSEVPFGLFTNEEEAYAWLGVDLQKGGDW